MFGKIIATIQKPVLQSATQDIQHSVISVHLSDLANYLLWIKIGLASLPQALHLREKYKKKNNEKDKLCTSKAAENSVR